MARGKQAAKAANRRAQAAQEKTGEVKDRLTREREESDAKIKELQAENMRLKDGHRAEAERLAAEEIARIREQAHQVAQQRDAALELVRLSMQSKEHLVLNACRYVSMTKGLDLSRVFPMVVTWVTNEDYKGVADVDTFLEQNLLPKDGWVAQNLRRGAHWYRVISQSGQVESHLSMSLDTAEAMGHPDIHPDYKPHWYDERPAPGGPRIPLARAAFRKS